MGLRNACGCKEQGDEAQEKAGEEEKDENRAEKGSMGRSWETSSRSTSSRKED